MEDNLDYAVIGKQIKTYRCKKQLTQEKLSELVHIEPSHISHIERATTKLSLSTFSSIANVLDASLDELAYYNLKKCSHVAFKNIDDLLQDCTAEELVAIEQTIRNTKSILRSLNRNKD